MTVANTDDVQMEKRGNLGLITLTRTKALNALNRDMCIAILAALDEWAEDEEVSVVAIQGDGDRAFCAGGDVVGLYHAGKAGAADWQDFFADEYRMNHRIGTYPKPFVALIDGITMGGGVGLSIHAPYRVATERTLFAMPETGIGLITDVGATHALPRLEGELGTYLGLTGARLKAEDCLYAGIATHYMESGDVPLLVDALAAGPGSVEDTIAKFHQSPEQPPELKAHRADIDKYFDADENVAHLHEADPACAAGRGRGRSGRMFETGISFGREYQERQRFLRRYPRPVDRQGPETPLEPVEPARCHRRHGRWIFCRAGTRRSDALTAIVSQ